jgi:hypothetical protein
MAVLKFILYDLSENTFEVKNVISYEISRDVSAPCDAVRLTFETDDTLDEINRVEVFDGDKKVFNGYADTQREYVAKDGFECFIYARSSACVLVDNEAVPYTYNMPSAKSLCVKNSKDFGFKCCLDDIYCESSYQVNKGQSCFAAINNFVYGITGKRIMVNVDNEIVLPDSESEIDFAEFDIISEKRVINRGNVVSEVDYKINDENDYSHHIKSRFFEQQKINRTLKLNLSSLPQWQRDYTLINTLMTADELYNTIELVIDGCKDLTLYSLAKYESKKFGKAQNYIINSVCMISDTNGERTKVTLARKIDLKEITYVAK